MSNDSKKQRLYETLFKSIKTELGIDIEAESRDPVKDFLNRFDRGENDPPMMSVVVAYMHGEREDFLKGYPEALQAYLWAVCREVEEERASEDLDVLGQD